jgi:hypothetical protein
MYKTQQSSIMIDLQFERFTLSHIFGYFFFQVAGIHFICGVIVVAVAHSFTALMVGRVFLGIGIGFGLAVR